MRTITTTSELKKLCDRLKNAEYITIDTEFIREKSYWAQLCLIQVAGPEDAVAIDPLAEDIDLKPFYNLLSNPYILKVFHAGRQDIEIFFRETGKVPHPVFDTQIAGMVCGLGEQVSYENLIKKLLHIQIDKGPRFTDWSQRPLTDKQLEYALDDVRFLRPAYEKLIERMKFHGRLNWLKREEAALSSPDTYIYNPSEAWQRIKIANHKPKTLAVLQEVAAWREAAAQEKDVPRNRLMRDDALAAMALHPPKSKAELAKIRNVHKHIVDNEDYVGQILRAVDRGIRMPDKKRPRKAKKPALPPGLAPIIEMLKVLLKQKCEEHFVAQKLIANAADLELLAAFDDADIDCLKGWRFELFGKDALALKHGEIGLSIVNQKIEIIRMDDPA